MPADQKAREDYIHRLSEAVDRAFNERDRLWAANGHDCPKAARQEEIAVALLDRFNAEVAVDMAEVERRRAENLRRYREEREDEWTRGRDAAGGADLPPTAEPYVAPSQQDPLWLRVDDDPEVKRAEADRQVAQDRVSAVRPDDYDDDPNDLPGYTEAAREFDRAHAEVLRTRDQAAARLAQPGEYVSPQPVAAGQWTPAPLTMSDAELNTAAREWVADCSWREAPEDLEDLTDEEVRRGVNRHYDGGWGQFVQDANGYDPPTIAAPAAPPPTTSNGGSAMPNIEEARAGVMGAKSTGESALAELAQAHSSLEDTQNALRHATEGSNQPEADQAHGLLAGAMSKIEEARAQVASALAEFEGVAQRL